MEMRIIGNNRILPYFNFICLKSFYEVQNMNKLLKLFKIK